MACVRRDFLAVRRGAGKNFSLIKRLVLRWGWLSPCATLSASERQFGGEAKKQVSRRDRWDDGDRVGIDNRWVER